MMIRRMTGAFIILFMMLAGCSHTSGYDSYPSEPDTPAPAAHEGTFISEYGSMHFNGDGESIVIDFDEELMDLVGLQEMKEGSLEGSYDFLSGELPPHGSFPIRYDIAHEMQITVSEQTVICEVGIASEDGSTSQVGVGVVTPGRIPLLFYVDGKFLNVTFEKQN